MALLEPLVSQVPLVTLAPQVKMVHRDQLARKDLRAASDYLVLLVHLDNRAEREP